MTLGAGGARPATYDQVSRKRKIVRDLSIVLFGYRPELSDQWKQEKVFALSLSSPRFLLTAGIDPIPTLGGAGSGH
jgi:hypothetical protein